MKTKITRQQRRKMERDSKKNNSIKPFITKGDIVNNKVVFEKEGLSPFQIKFVIGCENVLTKQLNTDFKEVNIDSLFSVCMYNTKEDYFSGLIEIKDELKKNEIYQEFKGMFRPKIKSNFIPLRKTSQYLIKGLTSYQNKVNNRWFDTIWNSLKDGGTYVYPDGNVILTKVEKRNGWVVSGNSN